MAKEDKKEDTDKEEKTAGKKKSGGRMAMPLIIVFSLVAIVFIQVTYIFLPVGMLPSIVAYIVDRRPGKLAFQAVATFNLSGMLPYLGELIFIHHNSPSAVQQMMGTGIVWLKIYSVAAMGWIMIFILPYLTNALLRGIYSGRVMRLEMVQKKLIKKWGQEVSDK